MDEVVTVTEEEIAEAIFHCMQDERLVVEEAAGTAGVAALLAKKITAYRMKLSVRSFAAEI